MEKEPAFKRVGINLDKKRSDESSRISLINDSNVEINLRTNNQFLNDKLD